MMILTDLTPEQKEIMEKLRAEFQNLTDEKKKDEKKKAVLDYLQRRQRPP